MVCPSRLSDTRESLCRLLSAAALRRISARLQGSHGSFAERALSQSFHLLWNFLSVILHQGRIIGNWNKKAKCGKFQLESELFAAENDFDFHTAAAGYLKFEYWNHYRPHAGLGGKMVKPYPQDMNASVREISFLGGLLHGIDGNRWRREREEFMHPRYARVRIFALVRKNRDFMTVCQSDFFV